MRGLLIQDYSGTEEEAEGLLEEEEEDHEEDHLSTGGLLV
jgi:hypothetical protein